MKTETGEGTCLSKPQHSTALLFSHVDISFTFDKIRRWKQSHVTGVNIHIWQKQTQVNGNLDIYAMEGHNNK